MAKRLGLMWRRFSPLEEHLLAAVRSVLSPEARAIFDRSEEEVVQLLQRYADHLVVSDQGRRLVGEYQALCRDWIESARQAMALHDAGQAREAIDLLYGRVSELGGRVNLVATEWIKNIEELATSAGQQAVASIEHFRARMLLATRLDS